MLGTVILDTYETNRAQEIAIDIGLSWRAHTIAADKPHRTG